MHKDILKTKGKEAQEELVTEERTEIMKDFMTQALKKYQENNKGILP